MALPAKKKSCTSGGWETIGQGPNPELFESYCGELKDKEYDKKQQGRWDCVPSDQEY